MRFVLSLSLFALLSSNSFAAPWDVVPFIESGISSQAALRPVQMQRGGTPDKLSTINALDTQIVATGLGNISAVARADDGTLYTADIKSGRIWVLTDRRKDGKIDLRRPLPFTFDRPSGLAVIGSAIYVADKNAVWVIETGQTPKELASLKNVNSADEAHILLAGEQSEYLTLGLTTKTHGFRVLSINKISGEAALIGEGNYGALLSLAQREGSEIWLGAGSTLGALGANPIQLSYNHSVTAIALPGQYETPSDWPKQLGDHIIAAQTGPGAMRLIAIPTEFGLPSGEPRVLVEGFLSGTGYSAWGQPGPLVMDKRGLFFADPHNGTLWRLSPKPRPQPKITIVDTASVMSKPSEQPNLASKGQALKIGSSIQGTQIDASSTIIKPSSIEYGSKLIKDFDEKKAAEAAEKAEAEAKKKRRRSEKKLEKKSKK